MQGLVRQAVGTVPPEESRWEQLHYPETELLPTVVSRLSSEELSPKAKGLKRYTWLRYQLAQKEADKLSEQFPQTLLLTDDLNLAENVYPEPTGRVLTGLDFLVRPGRRAEVESRLTALGWGKPTWPDNGETSYWTGPESLLLRLHTHWMAHGPLPEEEWFEAGALSPPHQLCRTCWQGPLHLWLVDAHHLKSELPENFQFLGSRLNKLSRQQVGKSLDLPEVLPVNLAQWALHTTLRRPGFASKLLQELALQLVTQEKPGLPHQWLNALCTRWSLTSYTQIPKATWRRLRGDFR